MPALSPKALASASPRAIPVSSTVWWASTSRSPVRRTLEVESAVLAELGEHVVEEGQPGRRPPPCRCRRGRRTTAIVDSWSCACAPPVAAVAAVIGLASRQPRTSAATAVSRGPCQRSRGRRRSPRAARPSPAGSPTDRATTRRRARAPSARTSRSQIALGVSAGDGKRMKLASEGTTVDAEAARARREPSALFDQATHAGLHLVDEAKARARPPPASTRRGGTAAHASKHRVDDLGIGDRVAEAQRGERPRLREGPHDDEVRRWRRRSSSAERPANWPYASSTTTRPGAAARGRGATVSSGSTRPVGLFGEQRKTTAGADSVAAARSTSTASISSGSTR